MKQKETDLRCKDWRITATKREHLTHTNETIWSWVDINMGGEIGWDMNEIYSRKQSNNAQIRIAIAYWTNNNIQSSSFMLLCCEMMRISYYAQLNQERTQRFANVWSSSKRKWQTDEQTNKTARVHTTHTCTSNQFMKVWNWRAENDWIMNLRRKKFKLGRINHDRWLLQGMEIFQGNRSKEDTSRGSWFRAGGKKPEGYNHYWRTEIIEGAKNGRI